MYRKSGPSNLISLRPKNRRLFKFCPYKIFKLDPHGNHIKGTKCPKPRSGHRIVADDANVYSFGGYNPHIEVDDEDLRGDVVWLHTCPLFRELWKFNVASQTWTKLKTTGITPEELASHAAVLLQHHMVVFGGTGVPFGMSSSNRVHVCSLRSLEWTEMKTCGQQPLEQYGQAVGVYKGGLFVVGGTTGFEYSMDVHRLDLKSLEWKELCSKGQPEPRYRHEIALYDDKLYIFGGGTSSQSFGFKDIPIFDLKKQMWQVVSTTEEIPLQRRCHGCVQLGSDVFICGGHDGEHAFSDIRKLNLQTLQWKKLPHSLPRAVYFHSSSLSPNGQMFIFGGVTSIVHNSRTNELYSVWLTIPSLQEICWQAILHYIPHIPYLSHHNLLQAGIPATFLDRVDFVNEDCSETTTSEPVMP